jgi:hypothetical protein
MTDIHCTEDFVVGSVISNVSEGEFVEWRSVEICRYLMAPLFETAYIPIGKTRHESAILFPKLPWSEIPLSSGNSTKSNSQGQAFLHPAALKLGSWRTVDSVHHAKAHPPPSQSNWTRNISMLKKQERTILVGHPLGGIYSSDCMDNSSMRLANH